MVTLTSALRDEYQTLFDTCDISQERQADVENILARALQNRERYEAVGDDTGVPWYVIAVIHSLESSQNFTKHLHNGDSLQKRTVQVPAGRPKYGNPPFTWEESAIDALTMRKLGQVTDWTVPGMLFQLEGYNGFGYRIRNTGIFTPYLWSFSNHYTKGKFTSDGVFSPTAVSKQCGAAVLLRRLSEKGIIEIPLTVEPPDENEAEELGALVRFSGNKKSPEAEQLQRFLNRFPGIFVKVDGVPGEKTSDAFKKVTGHFLIGDPRA